MRSTLLASSALCVVLSACTRPSNPPSDTASTALIITRAYVVAPAGTAPAVMYATIENHTDQTDTLTSVSTPVATRAELHTSAPADNAMTHDMHTMDHSQDRSHQMMSQTMMRSVPAIPITPGTTLRFAPGGYHIMLLEPKSLHAGDSVTVTLHFTHQGSQSIRAAVISYADVDSATAPTASTH